MRQEEHLIAQARWNDVANQSHRRSIVGVDARAGRHGRLITQDVRGGEFLLEHLVHEPVVSGMNDGAVPDDGGTGFCQQVDIFVNRPAIGKARNPRGDMVGPKTDGLPIFAVVRDGRNNPGRKVQDRLVIAIEKRSVFGRDLTRLGAESVWRKSVAAIRSPGFRGVARCSRSPPIKRKDFANLLACRGIGAVGEIRGSVQQRMFPLQDAVIDGQAQKKVRKQKLQHAIACRQYGLANGIDGIGRKMHHRVVDQIDPHQGALQGKVLRQLPCLAVPGSEQCPMVIRATGL